MLAQISQKQDERNISAITETMCPPGCFCHNGFVATHALGHMMHGYIYKGQSFKNVKSCLTLVVKVENLKLITRRQNICHESYESFFARQLLCIQVILIVLWNQSHERWKQQICSRCWSYGVKYRKHFSADYNSFEKMNPIKGLLSSCQKCMDKFFDPYFDILMNWASHFEKPQKSLPKFCL